MPSLSLLNRKLTKLLFVTAFMVGPECGLMAQQNVAGAIKRSMPGFLLPDSSARVKLIPANMGDQSAFAYSKIQTVNDTCHTAAFYIHLHASAGQLIDLKELQTLPNGNFILAGNVTLSNNEQEGLITILSNAGSPVSQKQIRVNTNPITLSGLKVLLDSRILIAGIVHEATDKIFVALLNSDLSISWIKVFDPPSAPSKVITDLVENDQIAFAVQLNNAIVYTVMNTNGAVVWSQQVSVPGMDEIAGFTQLLWSELGLVVNCTRSGAKVVDLLRISQASGAILSSSTFCDAATQNKYTDVNTFNARLIAAGIIKNSAGQFKVVRNITATTPNVETEHTYTLPSAVDFSSSCAIDNAGDAIGVSIPQTGKLFFIRHYAYYQTSAEYTREYSIPTGAKIVAIARSFDDGGYLFGLNTAAAGEIILIKTDSIGTLPGCGFIEHPNNSSETLNRANTPFSIVQTSITLAQSTGSLIQTGSSPAIQADCNQVYCPTLPPVDTCLNTYHKTYRSNSYVDAFTNYYLVKDNKQLATCARYDRILGNSNQVSYSLKLFDESGKYLKGFTVYCNGASGYFRSRQFDDQRIMLIHYTVDNAGIPQYTFTLINDDLQIIWSKSVKTFANYSFTTAGMGMGDLVRDNQGNYYFVGNSLGFGENPKLLVYKMDPAGNPLWVNIYEIQGGLFLMCNATVTQTSLVVAIEGGTQGSVSVSIDKNSGLLQNIYQYNNSSAGAVYDRFFEYANGKIFYAGNTGQEEFLMGVFDTTGRPLKLKTIPHIASILREAASKSGYMYGMYSYYNNSVYRDVLLKVDTGLNIQLANEFDITHWGYPVGVGVNDNGYVYVGGNFSYGGVNGSYYDAGIKKFDPDGRLGTCTAMPIVPPVVDINLVVTNPAFTQYPSGFSPISIPIVFVPDTYGQRVSDILCSSLVQCDTIAVAGPALVCDTTQSYVYNAIRNPGCTVIPLWQYDTSFVHIESYNNSGITVKFKKSGSTWLKAKLNTGCKIYVDSLLISVYITPVDFSLGNDTLLCPNDNLVLNAGNGFNSYLWQNGSTDSFLNVSAPGLYSIQVSNICGDLLRDTILIAPAVIPPLFIGNDSTVCTGDTLQIQASPGFLTYNWQPSNLIIGQGQQVTIAPTQNISVTLNAITPDGCKALDTLQITGIFPKPVFIGNDTSFCDLDSVTLNAGPGYAEYLWSTGSQSSFVTIKQAGTYWISAKDINGCYARDTIIVPQVYPLPVFSLGNDFNLCFGQKRTLDPGNYSQYVWQDGSVNRFYNVTVPGNYWVKVIDNNNCSSADTILLKQVFQLPGNFLNQPDTVCQYEKITLGTSANYSTYNWSTGSTQQFITVGNAGNYVLTVKDNNGCTGSDTARIIEKICHTGLYVPTAFTPNRDQLNDEFRARVYGNIISFKLEVYNRYGEKVFETTDHKKGWNGMYKGVLQSTSVFVWQCFYQLTGEKAGFKKGTVVLIR